MHGRFQVQCCRPVGGHQAFSMRRESCWKITKEASPSKKASRFNKAENVVQRIRKSLARDSRVRHLWTKWSEEQMGPGSADGISRSFLSGGDIFSLNPWDQFLFLDGDARLRRELNSIERFLQPKALSKCLKFIMQLFLFTLLKILSEVVI